MEPLRTHLHFCWMALTLLLGPEPPMDPPAKPSPDMEKWVTQKPVCKAHLRGLHVVSDEVIWASGTEGTVIRSIDAGKSWQTFQVSGAEKMDFRDIEAFSEDLALVMSAGNGVHIFRTTDGGEHWNEVFAQKDSALFYDGMDFIGGRGMAYGDPVNGKLQCLLTTDSGRHWQEQPEHGLPECEEGEAGFAASGTGIVLHQNKAWIATSGGTQARVFFKTHDKGSWQRSNVPLASNSSSGIFSMAFKNDLEGIAVGGSYKDSTRADSNCAITMDGGKTWQLVQENPPGGYRSCVAFSRSGSVALATGRSGTDISRDGGRTWKTVSSNGYFSCGMNTFSVWAVGRNGKMAQMLIRM